MSRTVAAADDLSDRPDADVLAAGAVLRRPGPGGPLVAVVHRPRYDDWSLPKGKADPGEYLPATAVREIAEETGCPARLGTVLGDATYDVAEGRKTVRFWAGEVDGPVPDFVPNAEVDALRWLPVDEAAALLSYPHEVAVLRRFAATGVPDGVLVVVRHAKAGKREYWAGPDAERPLSGTGREQARRLAALLPPFGPDRILSAPPVRCTATMAPLADALAHRLERTPDGALVAAEPLLGEEGFRADPDAGLELVRKLAALPGVTLVCSQGGVIPAALAMLLRRAARPLGVDPDAAGARKAGTWVLALRAGEVLAADRYSRPVA